MNWTVQILNGVAFGLLLFLISAGLSVTFGVMRVLNLNHGGLYAIGAFVGYSVIHAGWGFGTACVIAFVVTAVIGALEEKFLLWRIRHDELAQVLLTIGVLLVISDVIEWIWGAAPKRVAPPSFLSGSVDIMGGQFPVYRLALILFGVVAVLVLIFGMDRTRLGAIVRAGVDDDELVRLHGIDLHWLFVAVFAVGAGIAGLAGVLGGPISGTYVGSEYDVLTLALVVVVIGGLGSIQGALLGALFVGLIDSLSKAAFPEVAAFSVYVPMILVLVARPQGLLVRSS
ncbi:MAG: branched-chain amino acid transporter permease [Frankiales bacterium]|nr:branched-chain amino acid transporter permease [Frankiales bacterium]